MYSLKSSGAMGMDTAAGSRNVAGGGFLTREINGTMARGCGRVVGPMDVWVSALDTNLVGLDVLIQRTTLTVEECPLVFKKADHIGTHVVIWEKETFSLGICKECEDIRYRLGLETNCDGDNVRTSLA